MIREISKRLLAQMEGELEEISYGTLAPVERLNAAMAKIGPVLSKLKAIVLDKPFGDVASEIDFFKRIKPAFMQWQYYFQELLTMEEAVPFGESGLQQVYFENELVYVQRFFREFGFWQQYYRRGAVELDGLLFTLEGSRTGRDSTVLPMGLGEVDSFSRPGEIIFAKLMAFEPLREWLLDRIAFLKGDSGKSYMPGLSDGELRWTGDSINLAEVAVGLHRTGQINNGTASIGSIFRWLEEKLHVSIGVPSKRISEIKRRTKFSRTRFLDEMVEQSLRSFDREDAYDSGK